MTTCADLEAGAEKCSARRLWFKKTCLKPRNVLVDNSTLLTFVANAKQDGLLNRTSGPTLDWFAQWFDQRLQSIPADLTRHLGPLGPILKEVAELTKTHSTIEATANKLISLDLVVADDSERAKEVARAITFGLLGWQTMLFEPILSTSPSTQIEISDVLDGYSGTAFASRLVPQPLFSLSLPLFLINFGVMLPKRNLFTGNDDEADDAFEEITAVTPGGLNAATLMSLGHVKIKWIDVIAPHLEFDKATNTLFLYRYPSFCVANINTKGNAGPVGVIHGLATQDRRDMHWASEEETTQLLMEVLLSYRLLFAQDKASRRLFRRMRVFDKEADEPCDPFLAQICSTTRPAISALYQDRESYRLSRDFPIFHERLATLQQQLLSVKPRGWKAVWTDKRDTVQWWTFWAVIFFGGAGIVLSAMQVILQAIQLFAR